MDNGVQNNPELYNHMEKMFTLRVFLKGMLQDLALSFVFVGNKYMFFFSLIMLSTLI